MTTSLAENKAKKQSFGSSRAADLAANILLLAGVWIAYSMVRQVTSDDMAAATENAYKILDFQRAIGLPSELFIQQNVIDRAGLLRFANTYYLAIHFPVTVAFLGWVWFRHRPHLTRIRNTLVGVTISGLVIHVFFPLAPPRMIKGFVDTAAIFGPNPYDFSFAESANQIAAMPSLHVGWALVVAIGILSIIRSRWRFLALLHPILTVVVVVLTANHYWTDAIIAALLVGAAWMAWARWAPGEDQPATA